MQWVDIKDAKNKDMRVVVALSILEDMQQLEMSFGYTESKIHDSWFSIKQKLMDVINAVSEPEVVPKEPTPEQPKPVGKNERPQ